MARGKRHPITVWFEKLGIERVRSYDKQIPNSVFECGQSSIALFLQHLWSTDGNVSWKKIPGRKSAGEIYYATSSSMLAEQVQHLLLRCGILSSLRTIASSKGYRAMYHIYIEGAGEQLKFIEQIGIAGSRKKIASELKNALTDIIQNTNVDVIPKLAWQYVIEPAKELASMSWRDLSQKIDTSYCGSALFKSGIGRDRMMRLALNLQDETTRNLAVSDVLWDKIISVLPLGVENVYDATVEGVHNFVANDIIIHNSLEQDADVVLFIYREDRYNPESTSKNIAEIIVAKHRNGPVGSVKLYFNENIVSFSDLAKDLDYSGGGASEGEGDANFAF
ncbi:MAG: hypothetical protein HYV78_01405 [Candidatus Wildermuthbacteria bacterium]|nr:hypothetical protein [Candidatus Wildermuthbacteria bacterium]